jgi:hypothetical protein
MPSNLPSDVARQRAYYQATAASYQERHVGQQGEHDLGLELLFKFDSHHRVSGSFLDVGAGIPGALKLLATAFPQARVQSLEPVAKLRQQAKIQNGISSDDLHDGDRLQLPFVVDSLYWVAERGVLHHIRFWPQAVAGMARIARIGVLISDTNNIGEGSPHTRKLKKRINKLGSRTAFVWL